MDILVALIGQVTESSKSKAHDFFVEGIEFTEGRYLNYQPPKEVNVSSKWALAWNELAQ